MEVELAVVTPPATINIPTNLAALFHHRVVVVMPQTPTK